jgi:hypothetical protein
MQLIPIPTNYSLCQIGIFPLISKFISVFEFSLLRSTTILMDLQLKLSISFSFQNYAKENKQMSWFLVRPAGSGNGHSIIHTIYLNQEQNRSSESSSASFALLKLRESDASGDRRTITWDQNKCKRQERSAYLT